jgi:hypothetical protein
MGAALLEGLLSWSFAGDGSMSVVVKTGSCFPALDS